MMVCFDYFFWCELVAVCHLLQETGVLSPPVVFRLVLSFLVICLRFYNNVTHCRVMSFLVIGLRFYNYVTRFIFVCMIYSRQIEFSVILLVGQVVFR